MAEQSGAPEKHVEKPGTPQKAASVDPGTGKPSAPAKDDGKTEAFEERIRQLEERNGRMTWIAGLAIVALVCAVIAIVCAVALNRPKPPPRVLQAEGLELNDPNGRFRAEIGEYDSGWGLFLFDRESTEAQTMAGAVSAAPQIEIRLDKGDNRLVIRGAASHKSAVDLGVNNLGWPCITLFDKEASARRAEIGETEIPSEGKLEKRAPDSVVLSDKQGNSVWKAGETATDFAPVAPAAQTP